MARARGRLLPTVVTGLCILLVNLGDFCPCWGRSWVIPEADFSRIPMAGRQGAPSASSTKEALPQALGDSRDRQDRRSRERTDRNDDSNRKTSRSANFKPEMPKAPSYSFWMGSAVAGMFVTVASNLLPRKLDAAKETVVIVAPLNAKEKVKESFKGFPEGSKRQRIADAVTRAVEKAKQKMDKLVKEGSSAQDFMDGVMDAVGKAEQDMDRDLEGKSTTLNPITANMYPPIGIVAHDATARRAGDDWEVFIEAWIFRRNEDRHKLRLKMTQKILAEGRHKIYDVDATSQERYEERARLVFRSLVFRGGEDSRRLEAKFGSPDGEQSEWIPLPMETDTDGRVITSVKLPAAEMERVAKGQANVPFKLRCVIPDRDTPYASASARLVEPKGFIVISDIDDTVKITEVYKGKDQVVRNTFFEEFLEVPGMGAIFQSWAKRDPGMSFHFVSNSPPELMEPLNEFMIRYGFPQAPLHLRPLRGKDRKIFKQKTIEAIMEQFPERQVALIGDSGEADALIYANIYKKYPGRVQQIIIREVHESSPAKLEMFDGVPKEFWQVFKDSSEIQMPESAFERA